MSSSTTTTVSTGSTTATNSTANWKGKERSAPYYYGELIKKDSSVSGQSSSASSSTTTGGTSTLISSSALVANNNSSSPSPSTAILNGSSSSNQTCSPSAAVSAVTGNSQLISTVATDNRQQHTTTNFHHHQQILQSLNLQSSAREHLLGSSSPTSAPAALEVKEEGGSGGSGGEESKQSPQEEEQNPPPLSPTESLNSLSNKDISVSVGSGTCRPDFSGRPPNFSAKTATLGSQHSSSASSSHYGILASHLNQRIQQQQASHYYAPLGSNTIGGHFANPLLSIEPEISDSRFSGVGRRGVSSLSNGCSESLPRAYHQATRTVSNSKKHNFFTLGKNSNKQGIYQRSLSIFANGVSPLLRKKKNSSSTSKNGSIFSSSSVSSEQQSSRQHHRNNHHSNNNSYNHFRQPNHNQFSAELESSPVSPTSPSSPPANAPLSQHLSASTLGLSRLRRKSEPIMFSYDSITNELSKFTAREEQIVENINLDLEKMLMSDAHAGMNGGGGSSDYGTTSGSTSALMHSQHPHHNSSSSNSTAADASALRQQLKLAANMQQYYQQRAANNNKQIPGSSTDDPYGRTGPSGGGIMVPGGQQQQQQLSYKEPFYMVYEDSRAMKGAGQQVNSQHQLLSNHPQNAHHHLQLHHHQHPHLSQHSSVGGGIGGTLNDDNIYEEIDFLTLSSLRAQYADTLSLQSYKKKGGSKRSLASSSFTRWFSTRKKNASPSVSEDESPYIVDIKIAKKQRPPITLPEPPPELTKEQLKRRYIIGSIVDSENSYIGSLQRIINCYKKPLEEAHSPSVLSANKINVIFHRLEQILQCHTIFGIALSQCVREWDEKEAIGDVFIASFSKSMVLDIYSDFINNFTNAMETARKAAKSKSAFAAFLQERSLSSPDRLSFFGLMVKPVQRFPQFILLLSDLLKNTPSDHHDRMSLQLALTQLESLADRLNERKRDAERHFAVKQLLKDYLSSSTTSSSHRYLLRQDDIYQLELDANSGLVMKTKCRKLYLLNDMLVCVSVPANRLKFAVSLTDVDVMDGVTPATNNLVANSMLKSKDSSASNTGSAVSSPKHCTVERMYLDLNSLIHDLEVVSRVANLLTSLRYQYTGLSLELAETIGAEIREEIRKKDAQITLIDRSCLQVRIRSKNYKDIIVIQLGDPEVKRDWLTDVRLAKLALDRANNPAWDIVNESNFVSLSNSLSTSRSNLSSAATASSVNSIIMHRVPLFVKSLPIFATTEHSQLTCALHYRLHRSREELLFGAGSGGGDSGMPTGVLWICNVNENGSQLGALSTSSSGADISLIHSYELCDSHVTCIESVGTYAVWIGLRQGRIIVIDASSPGEWQQFASLEVSAEVTCIRYFGSFVYVGLVSGEVTLFNATHYEEPIVISLAGVGSPVTCLLPVNGEMFACSGEKIWIINGAAAALDRSYTLNSSCTKVGSPTSPNNNNTATSSSNNNNSGGESDQQTSNMKPSTSTGFLGVSPDDPDAPRPNLLAHCGIGLWVSLQGSSIIKLYHTETFKHLQDVNVSSNVRRILGEQSGVSGHPLDYTGNGVGSGIYVTAMLATRGLLWIGTNVGVIVTLNLPRLQGVPLISGCLNVALHRHTGPVSILLNLSNTQPSELLSHPLHHPQSLGTNNGNLQGGGSQGAVKDGKASSLVGEQELLTASSNAANHLQHQQIVSELKSEADVESIYGLYSDLMNVENYVRSGQESRQSSNHHQLTGRMTWDLANMNLSDDSTSESAIYGDGSAGGGLRRKQQQQQLMMPAMRKNLQQAMSVGADQTTSTTQNQQLSPAKSQSSIYDVSTAANSMAEKGVLEKENISSSSGFGAGSSSLYDIAPFRGAPGGGRLAGQASGQLSPPQQGQRIYDTNNGGSRSAPEKTALLLTGGNGYKRITIGDTPYSSQHAHCCIWEYKL